MGHDHPLLHLINEFEAQIRKFDLGSLAMDIILESRRKLYTIISQFNYTLNVEAPINKLGPDILYNIFTLAAERDFDQNCLLSRKAPLVISHICQHWRKSALGWPVLWRFISTNHPQKIIELFLCRSKDTPLELYVRLLTQETGQKLNLESCANRLRRLILDIYEHGPFDPQHLLRHPGLQLQLQDLEIRMTKQPIIMQLLTVFMQLDLSRLQSLCFEGGGLPLAKLPPNNALTRFIFRPDNQPILSHLLVFLSTCPLLRELQLCISFSSAPEIATLTSPLTINRLNFPQLQRLVLQLRQHYSYILDSLCLNYMRELSARIGTMGQLSYFSLYYDERSRNGATIPLSSIFELIPSETFDHFSDQVRLSLYIGAGYRHLRVSSASECLSHSIQLLILYCPYANEKDLWNDGSVLELIYAMPRITHLITYCEIFDLLNDHNIFQCLNTLELIDSYYMGAIMDILPPTLKKLVLNSPTVCTTKIILDAVSRTGVEVLELNEVKKEPEIEEVISTIRQTGIVVLISYKTWIKSTRFDWNKLE